MHQAGALVLGRLLLAQLGLLSRSWSAALLRLKPMFRCAVPLCTACPELRLVGLMTIGAPGVMSCFEALSDCRDAVATARQRRVRTTLYARRARAVPNCSGASLVA